MEKHHKRHAAGGALNLVSLMDIFTILVFFLLVNSSDVEVLPNAKDVQLPESIAEEKAKETVVILIGDDNILADGEKILGHILGGKRQHTERALASAAGVNQDQVAKVLAMAAPAILASLGRAKRERNLDASGLAGLVAEEGVREAFRVIEPPEAELEAFAVHGDMDQPH